MQYPPMGNRDIAPVDKADRKPTWVDAHVGERLRARRRQLRMTQVDLGAAIGLSFKQIRKYEQGRNRIGAATLYHLARALEVGEAYFFDGLDDPRGMIDPPHREGRDLARHFQAIGTPRRRRAFLRLVKAIADSPALQARWRDAG